MRIDRVSASSHDTYSQCNFKYFLNYSLGFESTPIPSGIIGSIAHKVLEVLSKLSMLHHYKESKFWNVEYLWNICLNRYYNDDPEVASRIDNGKLKKACKGLLELIKGPYSPIRDNTIAVEQYFRIPVDAKTKFFITGKIDRIDLIDEDTIEIFDYKSGQRKTFGSNSKEKKDTGQLMEDIQSQMYFYAVKHLYPQYKNVLVTFYYFTDGGAIPAYFDDGDLAKIKTRLINRFGEISQNKDPQRNISWMCKAMCAYGRNGICENIWAEKEDLGFDFVQNKYVTLNYKKRK